MAKTLDFNSNQVWAPKYGWEAEKVWNSKSDPIKPF